jgi:predicted ATPase/class 3 adenylate cyclase
MVARSSELPAGIVTFVLTDIEGSAKIFRRVGSTYVALLDRHRQLLAQAWNDHRGRLVETEGDAVLAAFADPVDAISACAEAQRLIEGEPWPTDARIRVRMGVHGGLAAPRDDGYVALAVYQVSRVSSAANGGQVLISMQTVARAGTVPGIELVNLGLFRLRDFEDPVRLFQPVARDLPGDFPPVRALPAEGHNLVPPRTRFVGRRSEIALVEARLKESRLVTVAGPGGVGKTRLVIEFGLARLRDWPDGVWLVDLAAVDRPELLPGAIADALGISLRPGDDRLTKILDHLADRAILLVLDNCEHQVADVASLIGSLLARCLRVSVLATSREPLHMTGEVICRLDPLIVPQSHSTNPDAVLSAPSVELFVNCAHDAHSGFQLSTANAAAVAEICRHLDGLPLAIEIAAARAAVLSPWEILAGLNDRFRLLRSRERTLPERQRTLRGLLDWSDRLLQPAERITLRRLALFAGSFGREAATAATAADPIAADDVPELVWSLVDKSLIVADPTANDTRYRMLETIRVYARQALEEHGEVQGTVARLTAWFLGRLGPAYAADRASLSAVAADLDNLRALVSLADAFGDKEAAQLLACAIGRYLGNVHAIATGVDELERWVRDLTTPSTARVALLMTLADLYRWHGETTAAEPLLDEAKELVKTVGCPPWDDVCVDKTAGDIAIRTGRPDEAARIAARVLAGQVSIRGRARMCNLLVHARDMLGDLAGAATAVREELEASVVLRDEPMLAMAHGNAAEIALRQGEVAAAARHQLAALDLAVALGQLGMVAFTLIVAARIAARREDFAEAVRLNNKGEQILDDIQYSLYESDRQLTKEMLTEARNRLGGDFDRHAEAGLALDVTEAIEITRRLLTTAAHKPG